MKLLLPFAFAILLSFPAVRADDAPPALKFLMGALAESEDAGTQANLLRGINAALEGRRGITAPPEWEALAAKLGQSASADVREQAQRLGVTFGSAGALAAMRKVFADQNAERAAREKALESLLAAKDKETLPLLLDIAKTPGPLRRASLRGLSSFDDPRVAPFVIESYASLGSEEKQEVLATLLARPASAKALTAALDSKSIPLSDLAAPQIRQLAGFKDAQIVDWLRAHPALTIAISNKQGEIARLKATLTPETIKAGDANRGRALFSQSCALCHKLFDAGADIGPEITGANRTDVDYLLGNILDPNALIGKDYQSTTIETTDGRILVGMVRGEDANAITLKTLAGAIVVPRGDVKSVTVSEVSMMPEGLVSALTPEHVRDLFAYLASPRQVPVLATSLNVGDFFNGRDFTRWRKTGDGWSIADGAIVARGNAKQPESLVSEMIAGDYKLSAQLKVTGAHAAAEIVLRGSTGQEGFRGASLSLGGGSPSNVWIYKDAKPQSAANGPAIETGKWIACEIESRGPKITVRLDGKTAVEIPAPDVAARTVPAFHVFGEGSELAVKDLKIEVAP
ncbi:MAG: family 16 glycoside hydrolase [Chthoniobacteraceae bacterium]